jgi:hypothetical protein
MEEGTYQISFLPQFNGYLYLYTDTGLGAICGFPADIDSDCGAGGEGLVSPLVSKGSTYNTSYVVPSSSLVSFYLVVDSASPTEAGEFTLIITPPP